MNKIIKEKSKYKYILTMMKFSNDSQMLMEDLMGNYKKYITKKNPHQQKGFDKVMKNFFKEIAIAEKKTELLFKENKVKVEINEVSNLGKIQHCSLLNSTYTPQEIYTYINNNLVGIIEYSCKINKRDVKFNFYLTMNKQFNELKKIELYAFRMIHWLTFIFEYANNKCSKNLTTHIYLTPMKKRLPNNQFTTLGPLHANSGVTTTCSKNGVICLYREEEVFKVFIHESFHSLGLDFSSMSTTIFNRKISKLFPIKSDFNMFEAYTEFWAIIMNCVFASYYMSDKKVKDFLVYTEFCIAFEEYFSILQCAKILKFMGLIYKYLYDDSNLSEKARRYLYKENTNIFAYYIVKSIMLFNSYFFIMWCKRNNTNMLNFDKNKNNLNRFYHLFQIITKNQIFKKIEKINDELLSLKTENLKNKKCLFETMRMSIIELI